MGKRCPKAKNPEDYLKGTTCLSMQKDIVREAAWMCASLIHLIDPGIIVFGGSAGRALRTLLPKIRKELKDWILPETLVPKIAIGTMPDAATRGAALLAGRN